MVLDADNQSLITEIDIKEYLPGASFVKEIFVSPVGKLFICANTKFGDMPAILIFDASNYTQLLDIEYISLPLFGNYDMLDFYTTSFGSASVGGLYYLTLVFDGLAGD
jgi:hypothetical protein